MQNVQTWDRVVPAFTDDRLLLVESEHRVANEVSAALAAMHLIRSAKGSKSRWHLLGDAVERLEGFATVHRLLSTTRAQVVDVSNDLEELCTALAKSRSAADGSTMRLDLPSIQVDADSARRLLMIASELVTNAIRYALEGRGGKLTVSLHSRGPIVFLTISDDGPGIELDVRPKGTGMGTPIVTELVRRAGGRILRDSGPDGTSIQISLPIDPSRDARAKQDR